MTHRSDVISGWWYMQPDESMDEHVERIKADPRYPDMGLPWCEICDAAVRGWDECGSCRNDGLHRHADCCTD